MALHLSGYQNHYLRGVAHSLKPVVLVGQKGLVESVTESISQALEIHELIKIKFVDLEDRKLKKVMLKEIEEKCDCGVAGITGHVAILYRPQDDPEKRRIRLPERPDDSRE